MENIQSKVEVEDISADFAMDSGILGNLGDFGDLGKMTDEQLREMAAKMQQDRSLLPNMDFGTE